MVNLRRRLDVEVSGLAYRQLIDGGRVEV